MMSRLASITSALCLTLAASACATVGDDFNPSSNTGPDAGTGPDVDAATCATVDFTATQVTPSIQLVIDRSGSMGQTLPNSNLTRYQAMRNALVGNNGTNGVVGDLQGKAYFGATLYTSDSPCPRMYNTAARQLNNLQQVKTLIESQSPGGNTPTPQAIDAAVQLFAQTPPPMGSPPIIVLATDGLPNSCNGGDTQSQSVQSTRNAYNAGIRTFVLGISGVNDTFLQNMANAGLGVQQNQPNAKFYTANSPAELQQAFQQIIGGVVSCELTLSGMVDPEQAKQGTVKLNGQTLTHGSDWEVVDSDTIRLIGQACETMKSSPNPQVQASFPCGAVLL
jgi:hypothetical protein